MARPHKDGFEYYPKDTDLFTDRKIKKLIRGYGGDGYMVYDFILCSIYRDKGYFIEWNPDFCFDIGHEFNLSEVRVSEIISHCVTVDLFDLLQFEKGILTSRGIQNRWQLMNKTAKRTDKNFQEKYQIKAINSEETIVNSENTTVISEETPINSGKSTQSKVKESKVVIISLFDEFRKSYPGTKRGLEVEFAELKKNVPNFELEKTVKKLLPALHAEMIHRKLKESSNDFIPEWKNLKTWINQKCWTQEFSEISIKSTNGHGPKEFEPAKGLQR